MSAPKTAAAATPSPAKRTPNPAVLTKAGLIAQVHKDLSYNYEIPKRMVADMVESMMHKIATHMAQGGDEARLDLRGFMHMKVQKRKARTGRNPKTGAKIEIAARKFVKATVSPAVNKAVN